MFSPQFFTPLLVPRKEMLKDRHKGDEQQNPQTYQRSFHFLSMMLA
jgi:hypothetical protein